MSAPLWNCFHAQLILLLILWKVGFYHSWQECQGWSQNMPSGLRFHSAIQSDLLKRKNLYSKSDWSQKPLTCLLTLLKTVQLSIIQHFGICLFIHFIQEVISLAWCKDWKRGETASLALSKVRPLALLQWVSYTLHLVLVNISWWIQPALCVTKRILGRHCFYLLSNMYFMRRNFPLKPHILFWMDRYVRLSTI